LIWVAVLTLGLVQWSAIAWAPLASVLGAGPLSPADWLVTVAALTWPVALLELLKAWRRGHRRGEGP
jgi:hypothetical protein